MVNNGDATVVIRFTDGCIGTLCIEQLNGAIVSRGMENDGTRSKFRTAMCS